MKRKNKKAQIWIETVIYTLIAFVMIGLVLSFVKPKIEEIRDQTIIDRSIDLLENLNDIILTIRDVPGNQRKINLEIKKGILKINGEDDIITFEIESKYAYSQPGENVNYGDIIAHTGKKGRLNIVTLTANYSDDYNLTYKGSDSIKTLTQAPTPYQVFMSNKGKSNNKVSIDLEVI